MEVINEYSELIYYCIILFSLCFLFIYIYKEMNSRDVDKYLNKIIKLKKVSTVKNEYKDKESSVVFFDIKNEKNKEYFNEFMTSYFETLINNISKAKESIVILDYLAHHNPIKTLLLGKNNLEKNRMEELYNDYFRAIESAIVRGVKCKRVVQLPLDTAKDLTRNDQIYFFITHVMRETYQHIHRISGYSNFTLHLINNAIRPYSSMIIDDSCYICEYDRYNKSRRPLPDIVFVDEVSDMSSNSKLKFFIEKQKNLINKVLKSNNSSLIFNEIEAKRKKLLETEKNNLESTKIAIDIINKKEKERYDIPLKLFLGSQNINDKEALIKLIGSMLEEGEHKKVVEEYFSSLEVNIRMIEKNHENNVKNITGLNSSRN